MTNKHITTNSIESLDVNNDSALRKKLNNLNEEKRQIEEADFFYKVILISNNIHDSLSGVNISSDDMEIEISDYRKNDNIFLKASVILTNKTPRESKTNPLAYALSRQLTSTLGALVNPDYSLCSKEVFNDMADNEYFTIKPTNGNYRDAFLRTFLNESLYTTYLAMNLESNLTNKDFDTSSKKKMKV